MSTEQFVHSRDLLFWLYETVELEPITDLADTEFDGLAEANRSD